MWIVDKLHGGQEQGRTQLDATVQKRLMLWYTGEGDTDDERQSVHLVQRVKSANSWIACDCLGTKNAPPLLAPAYLAMGSTYYLRRLTGNGRPEHHQECPFFRAQHEYAQKLEAKLEGKPLKPADGYFSILQPLGEHLAQKPDPNNQKASSNSKTPPKLARLLWTLLDRAERHIIPPPNPDTTPTIIAEFAAIKEAAEGLAIAPRIPFVEHFYTHARDLTSGAIYRKLEQTERSWPKSHPAQAFLLTFARTVTRDSVMTAAGQISAAEGVDLFSPSEPEDNTGTITTLAPVAKPSKELVDQGPYLTIIVIGRPLEGGPFQPIRAYAQPILSGHHFTTIDSNAERTFLQILLKIQRREYLVRRPFVLEKPLFDYKTPNGHCRPDFILRFPEAPPLILELMGYDNDDYQAAKDITLPRMNHLGSVHPFPITALKDPLALTIELELLISRHGRAADGYLGAEPGTPKPPSEQPGPEQVSGPVFLFGYFSAGPLCQMRPY